MGSERVMERFLGDQCELGESLEVSEAVLYVVLSGWCKVQREVLPELAEVFAALSRAGVRREGGKLKGAQLRGVDEKGIMEIVGPTLYEALQTADLKVKRDGASPRKAAPEPARGINGDSVVSFIESCCVRDAAKSTSLRRLYEEYEAYCASNARRPVREPRFRTTLESRKVGVEVAGRTVRGIAVRKPLLGEPVPVRAGKTGAKARARST